MDKQHFTVVAGFEAAEAHDKAVAFASQQPGFDLPRWQEREDFWVGAEIVVTIYGYGLRYASGLQGFGIIASAQSLGTLDRAIAYAQEWAASEPAKTRYVFIRNSSLAKAGAMAEITAKREAGVATARKQQVAAGHSLGYHANRADFYAKECEACATQPQEVA
jgi:hypothetical protein